jgi:type VI secretion system protein ImpL
MDLKSRIDALLLQDRMEQLDRYTQGRGITHLGLYQGTAIREKLLREYNHGMQQVMLAPTVSNLENYLGQVVPSATAGAGHQQRRRERVLYQNASPTSTNDAPTTRSRPT